MISHGLLSEDDSETVSVGATRKGRVRNLLRIIDSRGPCAESTFLRALQSRPEFGHVWFKIHKEKGAGKYYLPAIPEKVLDVVDLFY